MNENVKSFLEAVKADKALEDEFNKALEELDPKARAVAAIEFAKKKGFDIKPEDLIPDEQEVSLDELDNVAGGGGCMCERNGGGKGYEKDDHDPWKCYCPREGQGGDGNNTPTNCLCHTGGIGKDDPVK